MDTKLYFICHPKAQHNHHRANKTPDASESTKQGDQTSFEKWKDKTPLAKPTQNNKHKKIKKNSYGVTI